MLNRSKINQLVILGFAVYSMASSMTVQAEDIPPIDCMIEPNIMVEVSSPVDGVLATLLVDRSDEVKKGEVLATLKSAVEQVTVDMSMERLNLSRVEYSRAKGLYRKKVITLTEKDRLHNEKKLAELNLQHAEANLEMKQVRSPIDGVVVKRYSSPGEFVEADPIIKLAQLDPLKIEVFSPV
jgi:RND family efflux transporter MFP subunit